MYIYTIIISISFFLTILFFGLYNNEAKKEEKEQNKTNKRNFLITAISFLLLLIGMFIYFYFYFDWRKTIKENKVKYYAKKLLDDFTGDLQSERKESVVLEDCNNIFRNHPNEKASEQYFDMRKDFAEKANQYKEELLKAGSNGNIELMKKLSDKIRDLRYNEINFCKSQALQNLHFSNWNAYMETKK